jgi:hypothetical protein
VKRNIKRLTTYPRGFFDRLLRATATRAGRMTRKGWEERFVNNVKKLPARFFTLF